MGLDGSGPAGRNLGRVRLDDYLVMTGGRRPRCWRLLMALASVATAFTAGAVAPWPGRDTTTMTLNQALQLLERPAATPWQTKLATNRLFQLMELGREQLAQVAASQDPAAGDAGLYLRSLALQDVRAILALRRAQPLSPVHAKSLERVTAELQPVR
jgi:hypothetical protein